MYRLLSLPLLAATLALAGCGQPDHGTPGAASAEADSTRDASHEDATVESVEQPSATETAATDGTGAPDQEDSTMPTTDEEWRQKLTPEQYRVLRQHGTERAGTGEYLHHDEDGVYRCAGCGNPLYDSSTKFAHNAWPAFSDAIPGSVEKEQVGPGSWEVHCARCKGHLGHIFKEPSHMRH